MTSVQRTALAVAVAIALAGCARGQDEQMAYDVCLAGAKADGKYANAKLASKADSNIQASTGDAAIRVNIPVELDGKKQLYQCIADKQKDGSYKVVN